MSAIFPTSRTPRPANAGRRASRPRVSLAAAAPICLVLLGAGCESPHGTGHSSLPIVRLETAPLLQFRGGNSPAPDRVGDTDCNSPLHWADGTLYLFNSSGHPWRSSGPNLHHLDQSYLRCEYSNTTNGGRWIECTWKVPRGPLYGWYHYEPTGLCPGTGLTAPRIGAARSRDDGATWEDLGVVLEAPAGTLQCDTRNFYFAGGNGDFSILPDATGRYLYFFLSTYAGEASQQGVALARMAFTDRDQPVGKVWKWHQGAWSAPGIGGQVTPVFPARIDWHREDADAFWGPSVHWNHHLRRYVMLLNRAVDKDWTQEGVYLSVNRDLANPGGWSVPRKILGDLPRDAWYPQVVGLDAARGETDKLAGRRARLFVRGTSRWEVTFLRAGEANGRGGRPGDQLGSPSIR